MDIRHFWPEWSVIELLGKGSFGDVYKIERKKGVHTFYSALKIIRIPVSEDEPRSLSAQGMDDRSIRGYFQEQVQLLENEIVLMETVKSAANVVSIEDHYIEKDRDKIGWTFYIRMELLESLNHYINRAGKLSRDEVLKLGIDISNALASCEKIGIIHRDIKAANIFRNEYGDFKLGDFGIARRMEGTEQASTRIGTPLYEAPEIVKGESYDHTVDIYALGIVLYANLNHGRKPFVPSYPQALYRGCEQEAMSRRIAGEPFPFPDEADDKLAAIVLKACAYKRENRYQSAAELRDDLTKYKVKAEESVEDSEGDERTVLLRDMPRNQTGPYSQNQQAIQPVQRSQSSQNSQRSQNSQSSQPSQPSQKKSHGKTPIIALVATALIAVVIGIVFWNTRTRHAEEEVKNELLRAADEGDVVRFGAYEQDNVTSDGREDIEWIVLEKEESKLLLISKYILDCKQYNTDSTGVTWETCSLRKWLNETFMDTAFSERERAKILTTKVQAEKNPVYNTDSGNDTEDSVFLLSIAEAEKYFSTDEERQCQSTEYAHEQRAYVNIDGYSEWWLRSRGYSRNFAANVYAFGTIQCGGVIIDSSNQGVRPALWINLGS